MDQLPIELQHSIAKHLNIFQYQDLRFALKINLPTQPKLSFFGFSESTNYLDITNISAIELDNDSINDTSFMYLYNSDYLLELHRILHYRSISIQLKLSILESWVGHYKRLNEAIISKLLAILLNNPDTFNQMDFDSILKRSVLWGFNQVLEYLLSLNLGDPSNSMNYPLIMSISPLNLYATRLLLSDDRVDPSCDNNYPLRSACKIGNLHLAKLLINHPKLNRNLAIDACFSVAIEGGHLDIVKALVEGDIVDLPTNVNLGLNISIAAGQLELVKYFMESEYLQIDLDRVLMVAENHKRVSLVKYFKGLKRRDKFGSFQMNVGIYVFVGLFGALILPTIAIVSYYYVKDCLYPKSPEPEEEYIILEIRPGIDSVQYKDFNNSDSTLGVTDEISANIVNTVGIQTDEIATQDKEVQETVDLEIVVEEENGLDRLIDSSNIEENIEILPAGEAAEQESTSILASNEPVEHDNDPYSTEIEQVLPENQITVPPAKVEVESIIEFEALQTEAANVNDSIEEIIVQNDIIIDGRATKSTQAPERCDFQIQINSSNERQEFQIQTFPIQIIPSSEPRNSNERQDFPDPQE
ncbi:hypothetical protein HDV06_002046 [Boothiomyces sp. JEL0866]|nr:hypothetical protein HDV06_002046 [Boothiomyces sp. JEL0866]